MMMRKFAGLALATALAASPGIAEAGVLKNTLEVLKEGAHENVTILKASAKANAHLLKVSIESNAHLAKCVVKTLAKKGC
jgi:hypothetical protein